MPVRGHGTTLNKTKMKNGREIPYVRVTAGPQRGMYVHRMVAEALLRRPLLPHETVDHKNRDSLDCTPTNIMVLSWSDHAKVTNARRRGRDGYTENVDYVVILDGELVFQVEVSQVGQSG